MLGHDKNSEDAYKHPQFSLKNKILRFGFQITWFMLCRYSPTPFHKWRCFILRLFGAKIGKDNFIYANCIIWAPWLLQTEDVVTIGPEVEIYNPGGCLLKSHSILSQQAYLCGATHDYNTQDFTYIMKKIEIGAYSWICAKAIVLPGVTCFEGSVLGASSITSKNLEAWTVYSGNPAQKIKARNNFISK